MTRAGDDDEVARAAAALAAGRLVAFPTETVYGLGAAAADREAVRRLYRVKGRPRDHPVIVHVAAPAALDDVARDVPGDARRLAAACWPGPLTLVLRRRPGAVADEVTGGRGTVAVRVPDHPLALALLEAFGGPVAAPSANRFGRVSPTTAADVRAELGVDVDVVLDGGPCRVGIESTIVDCTGPGPRVLRVGGVTEARLADLLGEAPPRSTRGEVAAPGTLPSHYAPSAAVEVVESPRLAGRVAELVAAGRAVGVIAPAGTEVVAGATRLGAPADDREYAHSLYGWLRAADRAGLDVVVAVAPPDEGLGAAVVDRLRRASGLP